MKTEIVFHLTNESSVYIERLHYVCKSCENTVKILCKELKEKDHNHECAGVLNSACADYKQAYIELTVAQNELLNFLFDGYVPKGLSFEFNFDKQEVKCKYESA